MANSYLNLLNTSWNLYRKMLNVLLQNLMHMEHWPRASFPYQILLYCHLKGAKGDWAFGICDLVENLNGTDIFNPRGEFRWIPEGPVSQIQSPHLHVGTPRIISDLLKPVQMLKRQSGVTAHSRTLPPLYLRHSSFPNPSSALPTSQLIPQPFLCFTYVTPHSPTLPPLYLRHSSFPTLSALYLRDTSFPNPSSALPASQLIPNPFCALPTSQLILQSFHCFTYVTVHSPTLLLLLLCHKLFT